MIFSLDTIIYNHDRKSSIIQVLHTETWDYFIHALPYHFRHSPIVKEAIMTDINDLVQELWTSSDVGASESFFEMRCLLDIFKVCFNIIFVFATAVNLDDGNLQELANPDFWDNSAETAQCDLQVHVKFKILFNGYRSMFDQSLSKSKDLGDLLRFLPGCVVVQEDLRKQGMADLYRIKPDLLERFIDLKFMKPSKSMHNDDTYYKLDGYLCDFLLDRDRSQLYYCDPMLQHISICRHLLLSILDGSNSFDVE